MNQYILLAKTRFKDKPVATIAPTWRFAINKIFKKIDFDQDISIIEYGPGTGVITKKLLRKMSHGSKLLAIERNKDLSKLVEKIKDDRLIVVNDDVINLDRIIEKFLKDKPMYVISGIPFSLIPDSDRKKIVKLTKVFLRPGGKFLIYQFRPLMKKYLESYFGSVKAEFEVVNIPPLFIFTAKKLA